MKLPSPVPPLPKQDYQPKIIHIEEGQRFTVGNSVMYWEWQKGKLSVTLKMDVELSRSKPISVSVSKEIK